MHCQYNTETVHFDTLYLNCPFSCYWKPMDVFSNRTQYVFCGVNWMCRYKLDKTGNVCTVNVTISCVRANIFALESNKYSIFRDYSCRRSFPACSAHAPYWILCALFCLNWMCKYNLEKNDKAFMMYVTIRCVRANIYALENKSITYSGIMFVALFIQHAVGMSILSSGSCQDQQNSYSLCLKRQDLWRKFIEYEMSVSICCTKLVWNILRKLIDIWKTVYWCSCTVPTLLVRYEWNLIFNERFRNI
jgi:hypothetical protein